MNNFIGTCVAAGCMLATDYLTQTFGLSYWIAIPVTMVFAVMVGHYGYRVLKNGRQQRS